MRIHLWQNEMLDVKIHRLLFSIIRYSTHRRRAYAKSNEGRNDRGIQMEKTKLPWNEFFHSIKM